MPARAAAGDAAMVDDDDGAAERGPQRVGGPDKPRHVVRPIFVADQGAVQRVDENDGRGDSGLADDVDQLAVVGDHVDGLGEQMERHRLAADDMALPPRLDPVGEAAAAFQRHIDDGALDHTVVAIGATECDVHRHVEAEERLAAFRQSPDDGEAALRNDSLDQIVRPGVDRDLLERRQREARRRPAPQRRLAVACGLPVALARLGDALCGELDRRQLLDVLPQLLDRVPGFKPIGNVVAFLDRRPDRL